MGQSKKKRACPALNRDISPAECGQNRVTRYACPATCGFNVFAVPNYDALLEIEADVDRQTLVALARLHPDAEGFADVQYNARRAHGPAGEHAAAMRAIFFDRDSSGQTVAERWLASKDCKLNNDERAVLRGKMQSRPALLEIRRIVDSSQFEAVDLLDPEAKPLTILDRSLAARMVRFSTLLTWIYPLPHFWRVTGPGMEMPEISGLSPLSIMAACVRHLGGPTDPGAVRADWLVAHFERVAGALFATGHERHRRMLASMDGKFGSAVYALEAPLAQCLAALAVEPDIDKDDPTDTEVSEGYTISRVWFGSTAGQLGGPGRQVLGRLLFKPDTLRVDAMGGARLDELRARLEARLGARIRFTSERRDDVAARMALEVAQVDASLVPPELLEGVDALQVSSSRMPAPPEGISIDEYMAAVRREKLRDLLDENIPVLHDLTPREAATNPAERPGLVEWAKGLIRLHDNENLNEGKRDEFMNEFVRELGLHELDVPAPPVRPRPESDTDTDDFFDEDDRPTGAARFTSDWSAPPLPAGRPLTHGEAMERMQMALELTESAEDAQDAIEFSGAPVLEEMDALLSEDLNDDELDVALAYVAQVWLALVPRGEVPRLRYDDMGDAYEQEWDALSDPAKSPEQKANCLTGGTPQPSLQQLMATQVFSSAVDKKSGLALGPEAAFAVVLGLKVLIAELDHALRS